MLIMSCKSAKEMFDKIVTLYEGNKICSFIPEQRKESVMKEYFQIKIDGNVGSGLAQLENIRVKLEGLGRWSS